ncbi:MAG TPA: TetR/AcrR family transcriptional regulator [Solirubrobacteraceae bacterium]|nr:TetR/AcrR family transcriptional regulator [Solirubrobacteraceae bacterium]
MDAAADLLLGSGLGEVSMDVVARRARVSKATIYRWWPTKERLALDTLYHEWERPPTPDTGSLRDDLLAYLVPWVQRARKRPFARVVAELLVEVHDNPEFALLYLEHFVEPRRAPAREFFHEAIERGEIPPIDIDPVLDLIFGPIYHRLLHLHGPLDDGFLKMVVDTVLRGLPVLAQQQERT